MAAQHPIEKMAGSGGPESADFLNALVAQLWPNINVAVGQIAKDSVEPILASTLPTPLCNLRFVKFDMGNIPMTFSRVDMNKISDSTIRLDMDMDWEGDCDIELDGSMVPKVGVEKAHLKGRLTVLLCPLTNVMPLIGAVQIAFINPPSLSLDFTDAADIADLSILKSTVQDAVISQISALAVLPNRYLLKLDPKTDYFLIHQPYLGMLRLSVNGASGFKTPKKSGISGLINKIVKDVPDCYTQVKLGSEIWRTSIKKDTLDPEWNETHDFLITDREQVIQFIVKDDDVRDDDVLGSTTIDIKQLLDNPSSALRLSPAPSNDGQSPTLNISSKMYSLTKDLGSMSSQAPSMDNLSLKDGATNIRGLLTILLSRATDLPNPNAKPLSAIKPSASITFLGKNYDTAQQIYTQGYDILNPSFDVPFEVQITEEVLKGQGIEGLANERFGIKLLNDGVVVGESIVAFEEVLKADGIHTMEADVGAGAKLRVGFTLQGIAEDNM